MISLNFFKIFQSVRKSAHRALFRLRIFFALNICNGIIQDKKTIYVLSYDGLTNIGDEIQSIAVQDILIGFGYEVKYVHREKLSSHFSLLKRKIILNGWFSHDGRSFPPSKSLKPIFIGFHLANKDLLSNIKYFKKYEPIGARDKKSADYFIENGVSSYYSGCPTLTLKRRRSNKVSGCLVVDAHLDNPDGHTSDARDLLKNVLDKYKIDKYKTATQNCAPNLNSSQKMWLAEQRLKELCESELVITNRIHIALPCLAMGVPVIFVHKNPWDDSRISYFMNYFWYATDDKINLPNVLKPESIINQSKHVDDAKNIESIFLNTLQ